MSNAFLAFALVMRVSLAHALPQTPRATANPPGILKTLLESTKNPSSQRESLRSITGRGAARATFEAFIAWDPAFPDVKVKGLRVVLSEGGRKETVFIDDDRDEEFAKDSLKEFQDDLARLVAERDKLFEQLLPAGIVGALVCNRITPERSTPRISVFGASWYRDEKQFGVAMLPSAQVGWFYFPEADLAQVVEIVARGREFLRAH